MADAVLDQIVGQDPSRLDQQVEQYSQADILKQTSDGLAGWGVRFLTPPKGQIYCVFLIT